MAARRTSVTAAAAPAGAAGAKQIVVNDELLSGSFLPKGTWPDVKRFLIAAQSGAPAAPKFRKICQLVLDAILSQSISDELRAALDSDTEVATAFAGVHTLLTQAIKTRIKDKDFATALKDFGLAAAFADEVNRILVTSRAPLQSVAAAPTIEIPTIAQLRWRTDVTISTTALERVFRPTVLMQATLSDGAIRQFECSPEAFQQMRLQVALALRNMQTLAKHPTLVMNAEQQ